MNAAIVYAAASVLSCTYQGLLEVGLMERLRFVPSDSSPGACLLPSYAPEPFVRGLADEVRELFCHKNVRDQVQAIVRDAVLSEWDDHIANHTDAEMKLTSGLGNRNVDRLAIAEVRELWIANGFCGDRYAKKGWPFPILHGIDVKPGCILIVAGLNELAVVDPRGFDPRHESVVTFDQIGPQFCFSAYRIGWESVGVSHLSTLRDVLLAARSSLAPHTLQPGNEQSRLDESVGVVRNRGRRAKYEAQVDAKMSTDWAAAKRAGAAKVDFARSKGLSLKDFNRLLSRVRNRRHRPTAK